MLRNAVGGGEVSAFPEKSVTNVYSSTLLALRGGEWGGGQISRKKRYVTLEWPPYYAGSKSICMSCSCCS